MKIKWLLIIPIIFILSGCYNYTELNDLAIVSAIGIDKEDDKYIVTMQVINTQKDSSTGGSSNDKPKFIIYSATGDTIEDAIKDINYSIPKEIYINHLNTLVLSEEIAKNDIPNIMDYFFRNIQSRVDYYIMISKNTTSKELIETITPTESINAKDLTKIIDNNMDYLGTSSIVTLNDLLDNYLNENIELVLPSIELTGDKKENEDINNIKKSNSSSMLKVSENGIFKNNKLIGYLSKDESLTYNFLKNNIKETILKYKCDDNNYLVAELIDNKTKIKFDENSNKFIISINSKGNFEEVNCNIKLDNYKTINKINKELEKLLKQKISSSINNVINNYNSDIFGFADILYKNNNSYYKNWNRNLKNLKFDIDVDINISSKGNGLKVIK